MAKKDKQAQNDEAKQVSAPEESTDVEVAQVKESKDFDAVPIKKLDALVTKYVGQLKGMKSSMPWLSLMNTERRKESRGKFRDGEEPVLRSVANLTAQEDMKAFFKPLAKKDRGSDTASFETDLLIQRLDRRLLYQTLLAEIEEFATMLSDTILYEGEYSKPALLKAYRLAKRAADDDESIRAAIASAIDFYGEPAKKASKTKAARRAKEAEEKEE